MVEACPEASSQLLANSDIVTALERVHSIVHLQ